MTLLFLDFDGVLHPQHDGEPTPAEKLFCHLLRFEAVMRKFPAVDIVISSLWRYQFSLDQLRLYFSEDIQPRIIGTTLLTARTNDFIPDLREREILEWLLANDRSDEEWIAIDDAHWQFKNHTERLVICQWYEGFNVEAETYLLEKLSYLTNTEDCGNAD